MICHRNTDTTAAAAADNDDDDDDDDVTSHWIRHKFLTDSFIASVGTAVASLQ